MTFTNQATWHTWVMSYNLIQPTNQSMRCPSMTSYKPHDVVEHHILYFMKHLTHPFNNVILDQRFDKPFQHIPIHLKYNDKRSKKRGDAINDQQQAIGTLHEHQPRKRDQAKALVHLKFEAFCKQNKQSSNERVSKVTTCNALTLQDDKKKGSTWPTENIQQGQSICTYKMKTKVQASSPKTQTRLTIHLLIRNRNG